MLSRLGESTANLPSIIAAYTDGNQLAVITRWIAGQSLRSYLKQIESGRRPPISPYEAIRLFRHFAHGLCRLHHRQGIVHGDLKPGNLVISVDHQLMLIDFGNSWKQAEARSVAPLDRFTPGYAAPEIVKSEPGDFRSDQFSASVVLFEMLTGELPYDGLGGMAINAAEESRVQLTVPSRLAPPSNGLPIRISCKVDLLVSRGLRLSPEDRFPTKRDWLADLDRLYAVIRGQ